MPSSAELAIIIKAQDEASKTLQQIEKQTGGLGKTLTDVGKIAGGFVIGQGIAAAPGFLYSAAQAAADDAASEAQLKQAIENTGASFETYHGQVAQTVEGAMNMGFTDDAARQSLSLLMAQTGDATEAQKRFQMAMDLSRGANIDLTTASKLLGKVTDENVNVLSRYGIKATEGMNQTELFGMIQEKFGGQAQTFADSTAGGMERAKIQMGELKKQLGYALLPVLTKAVDVLVKQIIPAVQDFLPKAVAAAKEAWEKAQPAVETFKAGLETVGKAAKGLFEFIASNKVAMIASITAIGVAIAIAFGPASLAVAAIAGIILLVGYLSQHWDQIKAKTLEIWNGISDFLNERFGFLKGLFEAAWTDISAKVQFAWETIKNYVTTYLQVIIDIFDFWKAIFSGDWGAAWDAIKQLVSDVWEGIKTQIDITIQLIEGMFAGFPSYLLGLLGDWANVGGQLALSLLNGMKDMFTGAVGIAGDIGKTVVNAIIGLINSEVIDRINSLLEFTIPVPLGPDIHINPPDIGHIPTMARGGIVARPTLALLGEAGPEMVVPLRGGATRSGQGNVFYGPVTIQVQNPSDDMWAELERQLR